MRMRVYIGTVGMHSSLPPKWVVAQRFMGPQLRAAVATYQLIHVGGDFPLCLCEELKHACAAAIDHRAINPWLS
jgi:hypothetical protein